MVSTFLISSPNPHNKMKNKYIPFLILIIFILLLEIFLRLFSYPTYGFGKGLFYEDEIIGYKMSQNHFGKQSIYKKTVNINTNSKGLRDFREYNYERNNRKRILILGDSSSFGNGVELENSYSELLRKKFKGEVEIINFGVPGYGINNEYLYFSQEGIKYNPDIVLIQFSHNDWGTHQIIEGEEERINRSHSFIVNKDGVLISEGTENIFRSLHLFLLMRLRSYNFFYSKTRNVFANFIYMLRKSDGDEMHLFFKPSYSIEYQEAYNGYSNLLEKLKEKTNAEIIIFTSPSVIDKVTSEQIKERYKVDYITNSSKVKESIKEMANNLDINYIDISHNNDSIFLEIDNHWNEDGNEIVAEELYLKLKEVNKNEFFR